MSSFGPHCGTRYQTWGRVKWGGLTPFKFGALLWIVHYKFHRDHYVGRVIARTNQIPGEEDEKQPTKSKLVKNFAGNTRQAGRPLFCPVRRPFSTRLERATPAPPRSAATPCLAARDRGSQSVSGPAHHRLPWSAPLNAVAVCLVCAVFCVCIQTVRRLLFALFYRYPYLLVFTA